MCTVSFIPVNDTYFIVSNRDETSARKQALPPEEYALHKNKIVFPKDADAGGSWIAMSENGAVCVLLNGAFQKHLSSPPYAKSRGLVFLDVISSNHPYQTFVDITLSHIEPFTLILFQKEILYECRWDGVNKHSCILNNRQPYIWSSVTLYDDAMIKKREEWFSHFLQSNPLPSLDEILHFHQFAGEGNKHIDFLMNRNNSMMTVSITGIEISSQKGTMKYIDVASSLHFRYSIPFVLALELS